MKRGKHFFHKEKCIFPNGNRWLFYLWTIYRCISLIYSNYIQKGMQICEIGETRFRSLLKYLKRLKHNINCRKTFGKKEIKIYARKLLCTSEYVQVP